MISAYYHIFSTNFSLSFWCYRPYQHSQQVLVIFCNRFLTLQLEIIQRTERRSSTHLYSSVHFFACVCLPQSAFRDCELRLPQHASTPRNAAKKQQKFRQGSNRVRATFHVFPSTRRALSFRLVFTVRHRCSIFLYRPPPPPRVGGSADDPPLRRTHVARNLGAIRVKSGVHYHLMRLHLFFNVDGPSDKDTASGLKGGGPFL
ncbi:hypothetical protein CDAR_74721 [Caerostris darwini]|uniref:Uncharacterized protein n=1 Tax=Caerostris darwini TaxID=1538125 RepID=A0AAV4P1Q1_9ARAC|nr:hypothetical protein CDAR_74721 [Caerostris darwini]